MKLFTLQIANGFQFLQHPDIEHILGLYGSMTYKRLRSNWKIADAQFINVENKCQPPPELCLFSLGCLMLHAQFKKAVFPRETQDIEFLPILISGEPWLIANCLKTTKRYDTHKSIVYRGVANKEIFMVERIVVNDPLLDQCEMFTLDDSNRTQTFVQPSLVDRVSALRLRGVIFKEIGTLNASRQIINKNKWGSLI